MGWLIRDKADDWQSFPLPVWQRFDLLDSTSLLSNWATRSICRKTECMAALLAHTLDGAYWVNCELETCVRDNDIDAVVVGSGPNGLAAALVLAAAGLCVQVHEAADSVGGGVRTQELTLSGYRHDVCSAVHPMAVASPFFRAFDLASQGVQMARPEASYAHPLDGGRAAVAWHDLDRTAAELGPDGSSWSRLLRPLVERTEPLVDAAMSDLRGAPSHLTAVARLGLRITEQASPWWNARFRGDLAPALLPGVACHSIAPPRTLASAGVGLLLGSLAHSVSWPLRSSGLPPRHPHAKFFQCYGRSVGVLAGGSGCGSCLANCSAGCRSPTCSQGWPTRGPRSGTTPVPCGIWWAGRPARARSGMSPACPNRCAPDCWRTPAALETPTSRAAQNGGWHPRGPDTRGSVQRPAKAVRSATGRGPGRHGS